MNQHVKTRRGRPQSRQNAVIEKLSARFESLASQPQSLSFDEGARACVAEAGGVLLFSVRIGDGKERRWTAAVAMDGDRHQEIVVLTVEEETGALSVVPTGENKPPIAALASSYAGLAEHWRRAA